MQNPILYLLGMMALTACKNGESTSAELSNQAEMHSNLSIDSTASFNTSNALRFHCVGPRGGSFYGEKQKEISYRIFRIQIFNDTVVPIHLEFDFPSRSLSLLPDSTVQLDLSILPENILPASIKDTIDFGIKDVYGFFNSNISRYSSLSKSIQPLDSAVVYIGVLFKSAVENGLTRSILFLNGQEIEAPFLPIKSLQNSHSMELVYGIGVDPPNFYALIPCGQISFKKKK